jgi:hypothetical protein
MAKFRRSSRRRSSFKGFARRASRKSGIGDSGAIFQIDALLYGAARQYTSQLIAPLTDKIPIVGGLSDEVGMGILDYMIAKNTSGMISRVARKGLVIENARVGEALANGAMGMLGGTTGSSSNW